MRLWYRDEAQFEQALKSGEIPMGQYYHDVTGLAASQGNPVRSTFPKEGGVSDSGCWAVSRASGKLEEALVFIDYMSQPVDPVADVAQGRHGADREARADRPDGRGVRRRSAPTSRRSSRATTSTSSKADMLNQLWTEMIVG